MQPRASERIVEQDADAVEAFLESLPIAQRLVEPASELARPHRGAGLVDDQAGQVIGGGLPVPIQAKAAAGRRIKVHEGLWVFGMQPQAPRFEPQVSALDVAEECAGSRKCFGPLVAAERGECLHPEQRQQLADRRAGVELLGSGPAHRRRPDQARQPDPIVFGCDQLRRPQPSQLIAHRFVGRLDAQQGQFTGRAVEGRHTVVMRPQADGDNVVRATLQEGILHDGPWRQDPDDLATDQPARDAGFLDLVTDRHPEPRLEQLAHVGLEGVVGDAGQRQALAFAQLARGQRDAEQRRDPFRILSESFVEITQPKQHDGVRVLPLYP